MSKHPLNFIILHDGELFYLFERLGKDVPFSAYNPDNSLMIGESVSEVLENSTVPSYQIEHDPYEVMFNE